ncbi:MAG: leucyl aminopeptidase, partial [Micrococcales bacterium]
GITSNKEKLQIADSLVETSSLAKLDLKALGAKGSFEHVTRFQGPEGSIFLAIGIGDEALSEESIRQLSGAAVRQLGDFEKIVIGLPTESAKACLAAIEGALIANYEFNDYKSAAKARKLSSVTFLSREVPNASEIEEAKKVSASIDLIRDLVNTPPNDLYPQSFASLMQKAARGKGVTVEVWDEKRLSAEKCVGILSVGKGSIRPPRLVKIEYKPRGAKKHIALVGKGITFDTGGLTLKPGTGMIGMKYDMTGAATVGHAALAIAALKLNVRVTAYMCVAENMPSGSATRPNDIIKYRNGKTVEVTNTDAEGRLVLADGLILASEQKPDLIIDVATLTGAARVALGVRTTGLMGTGTGVETLQKAAEASGEALWAMPLPKELRTLLNSDTADMINSKLGDPSGGMLVGAHFLKEFVGHRDRDKKTQIDWAHLDIAGPASNDGAAFGYTGKGATGVMLRTLVQVAKSL